MAAELIIVTICDIRTERMFDLEVPIKLEIDKLLVDVIQTIMGYAPELSWNPENTAFFSSRKGKMLEESQTLYDEGIWNGDYLFLTNKY